MERALYPGTFIGSRAVWEFISDLETLAREIDALVSEAPAAAAALIHTFIAACHEKADEVDGSGSFLAMFVHDLFASWVRARRAARIDPAETARILADWMDDDPHGFCLDLERHVAPPMDAAHRRAFEQVARSRLEQAAPDDRGSAGYPRRKWTKALKHILAVRRDAAAYIQVCAESQLTAGDCAALAGIFQRRRKLDHALVWVERGLVLASAERFGGSSKHDLEVRRRKLLQGLGRGTEALDAAWRDFDAYPSTYGFATLLELVPADERDMWRKRALQRCADADLGEALAILVEQGDLERVAERIGRASDEELESVSHCWTEPAAEALRGSQPWLAARAYRALAVRILDAKRSKYYGAALAHLERARQCYAAAEQGDAWQALVRQLRVRHARKTSFMPGLERVASGGAVRERSPTLVERAKERWSR